MTSAENVKASQAAILQSLAEYELTISSLYRNFAGNFADMAEAWNELAEEELAHSRLLSGLIRILDNGHIFYNIGRFSASTISSATLCVSRQVDRARKHLTYEAEAIAAALSIEASMIDAHFYDIVSSDAPEYRIIAARLASDTKGHVRRLQQRHSEYLQSRRACA